MADLWGHGGEEHDEERFLEVSHDSLKPVNKNVKEIYKLINSNYVINVKPIFKKSCFDCHSAQTNFPWYYKLPGVKQVIDSDIEEARKHLDFSNDFPFISHDMPIKDLESIEKSVSGGRMPPQKYLWLHSQKKLTTKEIEEVKKWVYQSLEALK